MPVDSFPVTSQRLSAARRTLVTDAVVSQWLLEQLSAESSRRSESLGGEDQVPGRRANSHEFHSVR